MRPGERFWSIISMRCAIICSAICLLLLASCSAARQARFSTRYLPPAGSLGYGSDHEQLPDEPPALDGHYKGTTDDQLARPRAHPNLNQVGVEPLPDSGDSYKSY